MQQAQRTLQFAFRGMRDIQYHSPMQHPGDFDRITHIGGLMPRLHRLDDPAPFIHHPLGYFASFLEHPLDDPAPFLERLFRRRTQILHVARGIRPHRGCTVSAILIGSEHEQRTADAVDLRAQDRQPARAELAGIPGRGEPGPIGRFGLSTLFICLGVNWRRVCHLSSISSRSCEPLLHEILSTWEQ